LAGIEQIAFNPESIRGAAARSEIGLCTRQLIRIARNERNAPALRTNMSRKHEAESARATRDDCDLVAQGIARRSYEAQHKPSSSEQSARHQQNAKLHF
jgi:hypothetical protein